MSNISPRDWPLSWRIAVLLNVSFYNMMGNVFASGLPPLFGSLMMDLGCSIEEAALLPGYALLALGLANIYALPLCAYIGKRYTILITMTIFLGVGLWSGYANSYNSLVATRFIGGLAAGVIEAMGPFIIVETFHEHQLARAMVTYVSFLAGGSIVGPIFAGIIVTHLGSWRWFFWIMSVAIGANLVFAFFILPETSYAGEWESNDSSIDNFEIKAENGESAEITDFAQDISHSELSQSSYELWKNRSFFLPWKMADITRPTNTRFGLISLLIAPFRMLLVPSVLVASILFGLHIACTVIYAILSAAVLGTPPHLWTAQSIGLVPIASLIGIIMGLPVGGPIADRLSQRQTKRSNGHHDPRSRLPLLIIGFFVCPTGLIASGFCLRPDHFSWVGFAAGWGMLSFGLTASSSIVTTYCVDTFHNKSGHIGVVINVVKNCIGFGVSYATTPWFLQAGPVNQLGTMAGLLWASYLFVIPLYFYHRQISNFSERLIAKLEI